MEGTLLLARTDIADLLTMPTAIAIVEQVFRAHGEGRAVMPPKLKLDLKEKAAWIGAMPGYLQDMDVAGLKWAGCWARNPRRGRPLIMAEIFLIEPDSGRLRAVLEGGYITDLRTGAASAVAARHLARPAAGTIAVIGAGAQGRMQLRALNCLFPGRQVRVADRFPEAARRYAREMAAELGVAVHPSPDIRRAVEGADIIVTATTADEPLIQRAWVSPGAFIAAVGSHSELDPQLVLGADKVVVDSWEQNRQRGEIAPLVQAGRLDRQALHGELGEVVAGRRPGRERDDEVIVAALIGLGTHDVACAARAVELAMANGRGLLFDFQQEG